MALFSKRNWVIILGAMTALIAVGATGVSAVMQNDERVHISNLHRIDDDLYAFAQTVTIDGTVKGDLLAFAYEVSNNGEVGGSVNSFCYRYAQSGRVFGSVRAFANIAAINGHVGRSVLLLGNDLSIRKGAKVMKDVTLYGNIATIDGFIDGDLIFKGSTIYLTGIIEGDVELEAEKISITSPAVIKGNLTYTCKDEAKIDLESGVVIEGETVWNLPEDEKNKETSGVLQKGIFTISNMLAAFLFGVILLALFNKYARESFNQCQTRFTVCFATGILTFLIVLLSIIILILSLSLVLVGLAVVSDNGAGLGAMILIFSILLIPITSFASVSGGVLFYSGVVVTAAMIGFMFARAFNRQAAPLGKVQLLVGLIILSALFMIPYLGIVVYIVASLTGAGAIVMGIRHCRREVTAPEQQPAPQTEGKPPEA
jgi:cytoskeletal protein CcmA (bactofilin family)